jgi:hypothetical protein
VLAVGFVVTSENCVAPCVTVQRKPVIVTGGAHPDGTQVTAVLSEKLATAPAPVAVTVGVAICTRGQQSLPQSNVSVVLCAALLGTPSPWWQSTVTVMVSLHLQLFGIETARPKGLGPLYELTGVPAVGPQLTSKSRSPRSC